MSARIQGSEQTIQKIFSDDFAFSIPPYQRPYSWTTEQAGELLSDLIESLPAAGQQDHDTEPYFLGSIVLIKQESRPAAEVIDGQQRLTTLTILFAALRDRLLQLNYKDAAKLNKYLFQEGDAFTGTPDHPRLQIRPRDNAFFREVIQDIGFDFGTLGATLLPDSQRNIVSNYRLFRTQLAQREQQFCLDLSRHVLTNCFLVTVSTFNIESAYRIFSVMNDRGLDLSYTDILKSEVIGAMPETKRDAYTSIWEDLEVDLGRGRFENLFSHLRTVYRRVKAQDSLIKEFRAYVRPQDDPTAFVDGVLAPYARAYQTIRGQAYEATHGAEHVNALTGWLSRIDNEDWVPPALAYFVRHHHDPAALAHFFAALERLAAVMMVIRANVNERLYRYAEVLGEIDKGQDVTRPGGPMDLRAGEIEKALNALDGDLYLATKINRYVLLRLDAALSGAGVTYEHPIISIEHVLPQRPQANSEWLKWFPDPQREAWTHRLGNLVLLAKTKNSAARNFDFTHKKSVYFQGKGGVSPFAITTRVLSESVWTPEVLATRQASHLQVLKDVWSLRPPT
jgi:Protein of unknown function DUF262/Protein of unknown function (DUF1524)